MVNEEGTHLYNVEKEEFILIRKYTWKVGSWVMYKIKFKGKQKQGDRLALECFIGRPLRRQETVEHIDNSRHNNSKSNLLPRFKLFQTHNRSRYRSNCETNLQDRGTNYLATVHIYTPDGPHVSLRHCKCFSVSTYGSKADAKEAAMAWKDRYTLREGMVFV